jgi:hypothetical protein
MKNPNGQYSGSEGRRSSFSDKSEDGSPSRTRPQAQAKLASVEEVKRSFFGAIWTHDSGHERE